MSAINGDKARFNRVRKQKIARRARQRVIIGVITPAGPVSHKRPKEKSA